MSRLRCTCGHTIVDQADNIPYKAKFIRDKDRESFWDYSNDIAAFIDAIQAGQRDNWIREYFSPAYPTHISNSDVIFDIVSRHERRFESDIYQCEKCGRIKIQVVQTNSFASFKPEDDRFQSIFESIQEKPTGA